MKAYTIALPLLFVGILQASGCTSTSSGSIPPGGTYISESAGAHFDQSVTRTDGEEGDHVAAMALGRAHRPAHTPGTIYVAAGGNGIIVSQDDGETWEVISVPLRVSDVVALVNGVIVASGVDIEGQGFVVRTIDDGKSWETVLTVPVPIKQSNRRLFGNNDAIPAVVIAITEDPFRPDRVYAGTSLGGILAGEQSAKTWRTVHTLDSGFFSAASSQPSLGVREIVASPHRQGELAVITNRSNLWLISDGEQSKLTIRQNLESESKFGNSSSKQVLNIAFIPEFPDALFAGVNDGAVLSRDRGETWEQLKLPVDTITQFNSSVVAVSPTNSARMFVGINGVVYRSEDGGVTWNTFSLNLKSHIIKEVLIDPANAAKVLLVTTRLAV